MCQKLSHLRKIIIDLPWKFDIRCKRYWTFKIIGYKWLIWAHKVMSSTCTVRETTAWSNFTHNVYCKLDIKPIKHLCCHSYTFNYKLKHSLCL